MKKIFILIIGLLFLVLPFSFGLLTDMQDSCYTMDNTGNENDTIHTFNLSVTGSVATNVGMIDNSRGAFTLSNYFTRTRTPQYQCRQNISFSYWVYVTATTHNIFFMLGNNAGAGECGIMGQVNGNQIMTYQFHQAGGSCQAQVPISPYVNSWVFVTNIVNSTHCALYLNASKVAQASSDFVTGNPSITFKVGSDNAGTTPATTAKIDDFSIWNRSITEAEISTIFNNGKSGISVCPLAYVNPISINNVFLSNPVDNSVFSSNFVQYNNIFFINANVTNNGAYDGSSSCFFTAKNISGKFSNYKTITGNKTLGSTGSFEFTFTENNSNVIEDRITFRVCKNVAIPPTNLHLSVFLSGSGLSNWNISEYFNVSGLPSCANGFIEVVNISSKTPDKIQNLSLRCVDCTGTNSISLLQFKSSNVSLNIDYDRVFSTHSEMLVFNSTSKLYSFRNYPYGYDINGIQPLLVSCNGTNSTLLNNVGSFPLSVDLVEIGNLSRPFVNYSFVENDDLSIICQVVGGVFINQNITLKNNVGSLLYSSNSESVIIPYSYFSSNGNYTVSCNANNLNGTSSNSVIIQVLDTVKPSVVWWFPFEDNSSSVIVNNSANLQITAYDNNLYGLNISCVSNVQGKVFDFFILNLSTTTFYLNNFTLPLNLPSNIICNLEVCDSHTLESFIPDSMALSDYNKNLTINKVQVLESRSVYGISNVELIQKADRVSYIYSFDLLEDKFSKSVNYRFAVPKKEGFKLVNRDIGHFASWDNKVWEDYVLDDPDQFIDSITEDYQYYYVNIVSSGKNIDKLIISSFGGLNCISSSVSFDVVEPSITPSISSLSDISSGFAIYLGFLGFFWVVLIVGASFKKSIILGLLGVLMGLWFGLSIISLSSMVGVGMIVVNSMLFLGLMFGDKL